MKLYKKIFRELNKNNIFFKDNNKLPLCIIAGYTRSGTTFLGRYLSEVTHSRYIHEPLAPGLLKENIFHPRETYEKLRRDANFRRLIEKIIYDKVSFGRNEKGISITYDYRIIKFVRVNFFLKELTEKYQDIKFLYIIRNPLSCVFSRVRHQWEVPDYSKILEHNIFNKEKRELINKTNDYFYKMILSWILDNYMALRTKNTNNFKIVFYENLISNMDMIFDILEYVGISIKFKKVKKINKEYIRESKEINTLITGWKNKTDQAMLKKINSMLNIFNLDNLYNLETGLPKNVYRNS